MSLHVISDSQDERLSYYTQLTNHQRKNIGECKEGIFIVESMFALEVALDEGYEPISFLIAESKLSSVQVLVERHSSVDCYVVNKEVAAELVGSKWTRGVMAAFRRKPHPELRDFVTQYKRIAVLEDLVDVSNVGAIFRSAAALGVDGIVLSPECASPYATRSIRVSMGNVLRVPFVQLTQKHWQDELFAELAYASIPTYAFALTKDASELQLVDKTDLYALFFGSEGYGLSKRLLSHVQKKLIIPMTSSVDSLNVAMAATVAFWEFNKCSLIVDKGSESTRLM